MAANHDLTGLRRGNTYERQFLFKDGAGNPVDLTGSEIVFIAETITSTIRKTTADGTLQMPTPVIGRGYAEADAGGDATLRRRQASFPLRDRAAHWW